MKLKVLIGSDPADLEKQVEDFMRDLDGYHHGAPQYSSHFIQGGAGKGGERLVAYIHYYIPAPKPVVVDCPIVVELEEIPVVVESKEIKEDIINEELNNEGDADVKESE